jgi:hypothetical protein
MAKPFVFGASETAFGIPPAEATGGFKTVAFIRHRNEKLQETDAVHIGEPELRPDPENTQSGLKVLCCDVTVSWFDKKDRKQKVTQMLFKEKRGGTGALRVDNNGWVPDRVYDAALLGVEAKFEQFYNA